jgi:hypothetical protein
MLKRPNGVRGLPKLENLRFVGICMKEGNQAPPPLAASSNDHQVGSTIEGGNKGCNAIVLVPWGCELARLVHILTAAGRKHRLSRMRETSHGAPSSTQFWASG